jgi:hypothetical protein
MGWISRLVFRLVAAPFASLTAEAAVAETSSAAVQRTYLERAAISVADQRCNLFSEGERFALAAGLAQSRGELLRNNIKPAEIQLRTREVAEHARTLGCDHPSITEVAARVRDSYRQFAKQTSLSFPGLYGQLEASRSPTDAWAVMSRQKETGAIMGLRRRPVGEEKQIQLALALPITIGTPSTARVFMRDAARLADPWFGPLGETSSELAPPPRALSRGDWASDLLRYKAPTGKYLYAFYFSPATLTRIEALDPREAIVFEVTPDPKSGKTEPARYVFEIGDLQAAHSFVQIPPPEYAAPPDAEAKPDSKKAAKKVAAKH